MRTKKRVLDINAEPELRTYTHHGFLHAVISGEEKVSRNVACLEVPGFHKDSWEIQNEELSFESDHDQLSFSCNEWAVHMNVCFWRSCSVNDRIVIRIKKQLYANVYGAINLFVTGASQEDMLEDDGYLFRLGHFCKDGVYVRLENVTQNIPYMENDMPLQLEIRREGRQLRAYGGQEEHPVCLGQWSSEAVDGDLRIGFEIKLNDNMYYDWLYSNYIQIYAGRDFRTVKLDFRVNEKKDWQFYTTNFFLDYHIENTHTIACMGLSVLDYVRIQIEVNRYIEMWLNENLLDGLRDDAGRHFHQNLIYGYDDGREELYVLQFVKGIPTKKAMSYQDFVSDRNTSRQYDKVIAITYNPNAKGYSLSIENLIGELKDYTMSDTTDRRSRQFFHNQDILWGRAVVKHLSSEEGIHALLHDFRVSHLLFEKSSIMRKRMEYLMHKGILCEEQFAIVKPELDELLKLSIDIKQLVLMNYIKNSARYVEKIKLDLKNYQEMEESCLPKIISVLEQYLENECKGGVSHGDMY